MSWRGQEGRDRVKQRLAVPSQVHAVRAFVDLLAERAPRVLNVDLPHTG